MATNIEEKGKLPFQSKFVRIALDDVKVRKKNNVILRAEEGNIYIVCEQKEKMISQKDSKLTMYS
ncbi:uncharacterized protein G2W53_002657 [Senna tora]|uniref:Uncharacterized protein n=1 Tax=Senna tora TaxID=362788 RepID=A0A835CFL2_9FABA|nr:uncharacterized protein G2W53_002657 [Senna tora]